MKRVSIFGASGAGNVGDDLIAVILQKYLQKQLDGMAEVTIIPQQHEQEVADSDILVIGGGGLIYDYDEANVRVYTEMIHLAYSYRIPMYMMGMGVQHVFTKKAIQAYTHALQFIRHIVTRSEQDGEFIANKFAYPMERITNSRDLVFLYEDVFGKVEPKQLTRKKPVLALSLADWQLGDNYAKIDKQLAGDYESYRKYLKKVAPTLGEVFDVKVVCQAAQDVAISKELVKLIGNSAELVTFPTIEESPRLVEVYQESDLVITSRYHGLIAAIIAGKPVVGVSFGGHKQQKLIDESFPSLQPQFYSVGSFTEADILAKIKDDTYRHELQAAKKSEYSACVRLARKHEEIRRLILTEFAKMM